MSRDRQIALQRDLRELSFRDFAPRPQRAVELIADAAHIGGAPIASITEISSVIGAQLRQVTFKILLLLRREQTLMPISRFITDASLRPQAYHLV